MTTIFPTIDALYVDPPWSNYRYWRTMNQKQHEDISYIVFIEKLIDLGLKITTNNHILVIEMGKQFALELEHILTQYREIKFYNKYKSYYKDHYWGYTYTINFNLQDYDINFLTIYPGNDLINIIFQKFNQMNIKIVLDPCLGLGTTLKMCLQYDMVCFGNEVNTARLQKALSKNLKLIRQS